MSIFNPTITEDSSDDLATLNRLQQEKTDLENRSHSGYADAVRVVRLDTEIEELQEHILRRKQRPIEGE